MRAEAPERSREMLRKAVHVGCGFIALSLRWLTWPQALGFALAAFAFNLLVLPRIGGRSLQRPAEQRRGFSAGILIYPLAVAALILAFGPWRGLAVPAMGWALLAFGDGAASVVGVRWGSRPLSWNPRKSWEGLVAHVVLGGAAAAATGAFVAAGSGPDLGGFVVAGFGAALVTGLLESLDSNVDDNIIVPLAGALVADVLLVAWTAGWGLGVPRAGIALAICAVLGLAAVVRGSLTRPGAIAAVLMGTGLAAWAGWQAFVTLCAFFALGVGATRVGRAVKEARGIGEARGGRRGVGNVLANGGMALLCAYHVFTGSEAAAVMLVAALATAAFDTVSSEIGKAYGRTTVLVTSLRRVPPGTEGAVSVEGTLAGAAGAALVGAVALSPDRLGTLPIVVGAALVGTTFESVAGALSAGRGRVLDNDLLNYANTLVGAVTAFGLLLIARAAGG